MSEADLITRLANELAKHMQPAIPLDVDLWDIKHIAQYLKRDDDVVRERIVCLPTFPKAIRLPNTKGTRSRPLWKAVEVISWTEKHRETRTQ